MSIISKILIVKSSKKLFKKEKNSPASTKLKIPVVEVVVDDEGGVGDQSEDLTDRGGA